MRRVSHRPSRANSTHAAVMPAVGSASGPSVAAMRRPSPSHAPAALSSPVAVTRSPASIVPPSSRSVTSGVRSTPPRCRRYVSATALRARCCSTSSSRPSSLTSNSTLPRRVGTTPARSPTRATGSSAVMAARRNAAPASASAAAIAKRAETPLRWSTAPDSRTSRVKRAMTSSRCSGTMATRSASWAMRLISCCTS